MDFGARGEATDSEGSIQDEISSGCSIECRVVKVSLSNGFLRVL